MPFEIIISFHPSLSKSTKRLAQLQSVLDNPTILAMSEKLPEPVFTCNAFDMY